MDQTIPQEKGEKALDKLEETIDSLRDINQSEVINLNLSDKVSMLDSERKRIEERMEGGSNFFKDEAENALREFSDKRGIDMEEGARQATKDVDDLLKLYKVYVDSNQEEKLPKEKKIKEQLNTFIKEEYL